MAQVSAEPVSSNMYISRPGVPNRMVEKYVKSEPSWLMAMALGMDGVVELLTANLLSRLTYSRDEYLT